MKSKPVLSVFALSRLQVARLLSVEISTRVMILHALRPLQVPRRRHQPICRFPRRLVSLIGRNLVYPRFPKHMVYASNVKLRMPYCKSEFISSLTCVVLEEQYGHITGIGEVNESLDRISTKKPWLLRVFR